ncbi:MAG: Holliday junction resolvase RuvX [Candidatus Marinimicrobia bacterium]|nr:Holliday junction resolvase RuvX [Candidatus Neomarinimicrobiota bacterium]
MPRVLAVDFGSRRIGVAVSDPLGIIASPLDTLEIRSDAEGVRRIAALCREYGAGTLLMGYPLGNSGNKTEQTRLVDRVIVELKAVIDIPVVTWDERYTSIQAQDILRSKGISARDPKGKVDEMAARIILQEYLDSRGASV